MHTKTRVSQLSLGPKPHGRCCTTRAWARIPAGRPYSTSLLSCSNKSCAHTSPVWHHAPVPVDGKLALQYDGLIPCHQENERIAMHRGPKHSLFLVVHHNTTTTTGNTRHEITQTKKPDITLTRMAPRTHCLRLVCTGAKARSCVLVNRVCTEAKWASTVHPVTRSSQFRIAVSPAPPLSPLR